MKTKRIVFLFAIILVLLTVLAGCDNVRKLSFSHDEYTVISGIEFIPQVKIRPKKAEYELSTSNITIAKVKDKTTIITLREGIVDITVTSGEKSATCTLYVDDNIEYDSDNVKFADTVTVNFIITNYELANLNSQSYGTPILVIKGGYLNLPTEPYIKGYIVHHWYTDRECTKKFDQSSEINSNLTLFAYLEQRETSFVIKDGLIAGLTYDNLPHSVLDLPQFTPNGTEIIGIADNAFYNDHQIVTVNIPYTYKTIGDSAFAGCKNLTDVNFVGGQSQLEVVGINAFGVVKNELGKEIAWVEKLSSLSLPSSVYEVGAYAFYKCQNLALNGIPSAIDKVRQYAFAYTKINNVDFDSVTEILEGAFFGCKELDSVYNTHNVTQCYQYAFDDTKLYSDANSKYLNSIPRKDQYAVFYADTIAFGINNRYSNLYGTGDIILKESCTLIADKAFFGSYLKNLTLYLDTQKANQVLDQKSYDFLGFDIMEITLGNKIVVPQSKVNEYKSRYLEYVDIICYQDIKEFLIEEAVNFGEHKVLVFENENGAKSYHYHRYTGDAKIVSLESLGYAGATFTRISQFAFSNLDTLEELNFSNVENIAPLAITSSCENLKKIDLTNCVTVPTVSRDSFQISALDNCKIYVKSADLISYQNAWQSFATMVSKLVGV